MVPGIEDDDYTLTIQMDNGNEATIAVLEEFYERAIHGEPLMSAIRKAFWVSVC